MADGTIKGAWQDAQNAFIEVDIVVGNDDGENIIKTLQAAVPLGQLEGKTLAEKKAALLAAAKALWLAEGAKAQALNITGTAKF